MGADEHHIVVSFPTSITLSSVSVTSGAASLAGASVNSNEVIVDLSGVTNRQRVEITLSNVNNGTSTSNVIAMANTPSLNASRRPLDTARLFLHLRQRPPLARSNKSGRGRNRAEADPLASLCEEYALSRSIAQQHRNKVQHQAARINRTLSEQPGTARIFSIASGSCPDFRLVGDRLQLGDEVAAGAVREVRLQALFQGVESTFRRASRRSRAATGERGVCAVVGEDSSRGGGRPGGVGAAGGAGVPDTNAARGLRGGVTIEPS